MMLPKTSLSAAAASARLINIRRPSSCISSYQTVSSTSSIGPRSSRNPPPSCRLLSGRRGYATVNDWRSGGPSSSSASQDASSWPKSLNPTPYEILGTSQGAPYTKKRFHELVKLYHPDKHDHSSALGNLPHAVRLERYRLVIAANDLLSDPDKRRLYDSRGLGWTGPGGPTFRESVRYQDHLWREREGSAAGNATWEDWERWYERRDGAPRAEPLYMSNGVFATLIVALCMVGAFAQMSRADNAGTQYVEQVERRHGHVAAEMQRSAMAAQRRSREEQVEGFLRDRENAAFVFVPSRFEPSEKHP